MKFTLVLQSNGTALKMAAGIPPRGSERGHVTGLLEHGEGLGVLHTG